MAKKGQIFMDTATVPPTSAKHEGIAPSYYNGKGNKIFNEMATTAPGKDLKVRGSAGDNMSWSSNADKGVVINPMATISPTNQKAPKTITGSGAGAPMGTYASFPKPNAWDE